MTKKILLADDSITIQKVVELTFSDGDYEVIATNNGARAIEKLEQVQPDIILSDIIMPEKNGYEVCEFVKSHPTYKNIPVILLTGTFEPFDPDRAEKAGCDAVVTKPFESQGLIQKVEQLINQSSTPTAPQAAVQEAPPVAPEPPVAPAPPVEAPPVSEASPFDDEPPAAPAPEPPPAPGGEEGLGETKLIPKFTFDDLQKMHGEHAAQAQQEAEPPAPEPPAPAPFEVAPPEPEAPAAFEGIPMAPPAPDLPPPAPQPIEMAPPAPEPEPVPPATPEPDGGETKLIPKMTFDDLQKMREEALQKEPEPAPEEPPPFEAEPAPPAAAAEPSPFESEQTPAEAPHPPEHDVSSRATVAMPSLSGIPYAPDQLPPQEPPAPEPQPFDESPLEMPEPAPDLEPELTSAPAPWESPAPEPEAAPPAPEPEPEPVLEAPAAPEPEPAPESVFEPEAPAPEPVVEAPAEPEPAPLEMQPEPEPAPALEEPVPAAAAGDLTDEQIDRIARRVVELMSDKAIRDIAWEVIPDLAEIAVRERIRELENED